jgi:adenosine deaminase
MFHTDIGKEYVDLCMACNYGPSQVREFCLNGVAGSWLDDSEKARFRRQFEREIDDLEAQLDAATAV